MGRTLLSTAKCLFCVKRSHQLKWCWNYCPCTNTHLLFWWHANFNDDDDVVVNYVFWGVTQRTNDTEEGVPLGRFPPKQIQFQLTGEECFFLRLTVTTQRNVYASQTCLNALLEVPFFSLVSLMTLREINGNCVLVSDPTVLLSGLHISLLFTHDKRCVNGFVTGHKVSSTLVGYHREITGSTTTDR